MQNVKLSKRNWRMIITNQCELVFRDVLAVTKRAKLNWMRCKDTCSWDKVNALWGSLCVQQAAFTGPHPDRDDFYTRRFWREHANSEAKTLFRRRFCEGPFLKDDSLSQRTTTELITDMVQYTEKATCLQWNDIAALLAIFVHRVTDIREDILYF